MTFGLVERSVRCPCCKRHFTVHVDSLRHIFVEARPQGWPANHFIGSAKGARKVKKGVDLLRDKRENTIERYPGQTRAWDTQGRAAEDDERRSDGPDGEVQDPTSPPGEEDD